ncbi:MULTISPECIES: HNH/ENDO VII family nuclease [Morganella]|uniref:HNH/ENDO VII family nuclease n=1 Tax=Morganella TaxID=581 RepID=UPI0021D204F0|nr:MULTISPECIES: HNH/ENDO VII family nuclease [Morganella]MCU6376726.1 HNH/ENDO VII family nuclease [Morganella morganii]MDH0354496.1 HNH/ENDO VII family nuclease [Morganella sp. GD04133]
MIGMTVLKELAAESLGELLASVKDIRIEDINIEELDKPVNLELPRNELTPLSEETKEVLSEEGYTDEVIESINSEEEAAIYQDAGLECQTVNGNDALINTEIDPDQTDALGDTNLGRMEKGKSPLDANGKPIELHHVGQRADSPLAELTHAQHMEGGNNTILHDTTKESEIDRSAFAKEREAHWKARAEEIKQRREEAV